MRRLLLCVLAIGISGSGALAQLAPTVVGAALDISGGKLTATVQSAGVGAAIRVDAFRVSIPYRPSGKLLLAPVTSLLDLAIAETDMSVGRVSVNVKPLEQAGVTLPGGFIGALIRAQLQAFDTRDISLSIRAGKLAFAAKSGIVSTKVEGALQWGEGAVLALRVDSIRANFGLPIPRPLIMKRLVWLDPLEFVDVRDNHILLDVQALAKVIAESLPTSVRFQLPDIQ